MGTPAPSPTPSPGPGAADQAGPPPDPAAEAVTVLLVRHGLTDATGPRLAGRAPGVHLNEVGREQAARLAGRLAGLNPAAVLSSPLERCRETAAAVAAELGVTVAVDERFTECDYGTWTGRELTELAQDPLWRVVQDHPSAVRFPGGESLAAASARAVAALREWNARLLESTPGMLSGREEPLVYLVCSHGDLIKAVVADALGLHLDHFQRIRVDPCSVTSITYTRTRPFLNRLNDAGQTLEGVLPTSAEASGDAPVGGGSGTAGGSGGG